MWQLYKRHPGFVLGFHGCDQEVGEAILSGKSKQAGSNNNYDWLGPGMYFWEGNPERARQFAIQAASSNPLVSKGRVYKPFVVGAIIDLGLCFNLLDSDALAELAQAYRALSSAHKSQCSIMPENKHGPDLSARFLDCAVIKSMQKLRADAGHPAYDTIRGAFWEGGPLYPGAGFSKHAHMQIAVVSQDSIRGYFRPIESADPLPAKKSSSKKRAGASSSTKAKASAKKKARHRATSKKAATHPAPPKPVASKKTSHTKHSKTKRSSASVPHR